MEIINIPRTQIKPNDYNPNEMDDDSFTELQNEIEHLKTLPKPIIVRKVKDNFEIVDGFHSFMASIGVLDTLPCEIIDADNFESMRQTYKRNQHGIHSKILEGKMFQKMLDERKMSIRELAYTINISEGTIRNSLLYYHAFKECNDDNIKYLSVKQIRWFSILPSPLNYLWYQEGANVEQLESITKKYFFYNIYQENLFEQLKEYFQNLNKDILIRLNKINSSRFIDAVKNIYVLIKWESDFINAGINKEELREYTKYFFNNEWVVREESMINDALNMIIQIENGKPFFILNPDEFKQIIDNHNGGDSASDFWKRLKIKIFEKTGKQVQDKEDVQNRLNEIELLNAPDYIRESELKLEQKMILWRIQPSILDDKELFEKARKEVAGQKCIVNWKWKGKTEYEAVYCDIQEAIVNLECRQTLNLDNENMINQIVGVLYDNKDEDEKKNKMINVLLQLDKEQIALLYEWLKTVSIHNYRIMQIKVLSKS